MLSGTPAAHQQVERLPPPQPPGLKPLPLPNFAAQLSSFSLPLPDFLLFAFQIYYFNMACDLEKGRIKYPEKSWCLTDFGLNPGGNHSVFYGIFVVTLFFF